MAVLYSINPIPLVIMNKRTWLMDLARAERKLIQELGAHHKQAKAARQAFKEAWDQVNAFDQCWDLPPFIKETN